MLAFTRKTDYALVALAGLASEPWATRSATQLATEFHLPLPALRNILKRLAHSGIVTASHGPAGGYRLSRPAAQITIAEVVSVMEGPMRLATCCGPESVDEQGKPLCRREDSCRIKGHVRALHQRMIDFLGDVTLAQIAAGEMQASEKSVSLTVA